jgi:hypothetical protein
MTNEHQTFINGFASNNGYLPFTKKWLEVLCKSENDLKFFEENFYSGKIERETFEVFDFRMYKLKNRLYTFAFFVAETESNLKQALENLCLCPIDDTDINFFNQNLEKHKFTLYSFYHMQSEKPKLSFFRLLREVCNF